MLFAPATASSLPLIPTSTTIGPFSIAVNGSLFARARNTRLARGEPATDYAISRARIGLDLGYSNLLRLVIEPDFAGDFADPADVFLDVTPVEELGLRVGRAKVPFGDLELTGRWRLPSIERGVLSNVVAKRLGIGLRKLGARATARLRGILLKPRLDAGVYRDAPDSPDTDVAGRLELKPVKGATISLSGYARGGGSASGGYGFAGALGFLYDRKGWFASIEGVLVRAMLVRQDGFRDEDATLAAGRVLLAYAIRLGDFALEPYAGGEILDPSARTRSDVGGAVRGGLNLRFLDYGRLGLEVDHQRGQEAFAEPERTVITVFLGVAIE